VLLGYHAAVAGNDHVGWSGHRVHQQLENAVMCGDGSVNRRGFLRTAAAAAAAAWPGRASAAPAFRSPQPGRTEPTQFQLACMTLPWSAFPLDRALDGVRAAGYDYVAWGVTHMEADGQRRPVLDVQAPPSAAADLARRCRDRGLTPVMMFSTVFLEEADAGRAHVHRVEQAAAAGVPFLLTFGRTRPGEYERVIAALREVGPVARQHGVTVVIKQHGGNTATGADCSRIIHEVNDPGVWMCYDAGNVMDYEGHDPIPDIASCWQDIRAFAIKDHRDVPKDEDCGPGFGEIDHYRLLRYVMRTGQTMPLACENIFEPLVPRPTTPEGVDVLARRAREYVDTVIRGLQAAPDGAWNQ
jgi:sugar phosphate isomerase/epimerase